METNFDQLVIALNKSPLTTNVLDEITLLLKQQTSETLSSFISQSYQSLLTLEQWAWQILSQDSNQWINQQLFHTLASFNKELIFNYKVIEVDAKATLLFSVTVDQVNSIFKQIERSNDDNDPFITIISLWFDNHSYFIHDNPHCNALSITDHINQYITHNYVMSEQFKFYLTQLQQPLLSQSIFTAKMLFYIKTCSFSLFSYIGVRVDGFPCNADEMLRYIEYDYLQIVRVHSHTVASWSKELLACMAHFISLTAGLCWWDVQKRTQTEILFPTEQITCDHVQDLVRIMSHRPFQKQIRSVRSNDETILMDGTLMHLTKIVHTQNINWFFRSSIILQNMLLTVAEISLFDKICICAYGILGEVLADEQLKDLKIVDPITGFFFNMLEQAWYHPSKACRKISIEYFLRGFLNVSKHDVIQQKTADMKKIPLLFEMCDSYPIVYDILWALSFNHDIQQQLRSSSLFMSKLAHLAKECDNEQMRKITHGILWNLEINHEDRLTSDIGHKETFDIMISYSHKEKTLSKQIYDELTKAGYRVWIDFDQMHGNIMDAMAYAIERSHTIIICMSEQYRRSNYCRAEAHYAFQRQLKIVPVLLQKHYKADGWLLFLIGQLLYIDFTKYEFVRAMEMLSKELKAEHLPETNVVAVRPEEDTDIVPPISSVSSLKASVLPVIPHNIFEWTSSQVQDWLIENNLVQMSRLLTNCDGRTLVYLNKYMQNSRSQQILTLLQEDSLRRTNQNISLIELSCFHSLMDRQRRFLQSVVSTQRTKTNSNVEKKDS